MTKALFIQAMAKFFMGVVLIGVLLFVPAGTLGYWNGWLLLAILFIPMFCAGLVLMRRNPALLRRRLNAKESESEQKAVLILSGLMFLAAFIAAGLNYRFRWLVLPRWTAWLGAAVFLAAYGMYAEVLRENTYLSRTVEVQDGQEVVDTGLYGVVRHPMYCATLFLFVSMGLVLGSPISVLILLLYVPIIAKRIRNEEAVLAEGLKGYRAYMRKVRWRVIPGVW